MERVAPRDRTSFTSLPILGGIGVLRATYHSHSFSPHTHETFAIGVFDRGSATVRCENRVADAGVSDVLVIQPGAVHSAWSPGGREWRYRSFYPSAQVFTSLVEESGAAGAREGFGRHVIHDPALARRLKAALAGIEQRNAPLGMEELLVAALQKLWAHTIAHGCPAPIRVASAASLSRAKDYIDSHTEPHISLADIAQVAGLSRYRLIRDFAQRFGLTPYAYYLQRRIAEAKHLLDSGMGPAQVAASCGFADQSHLTRHFKRLVGVTPGAYAFGLSHRPPWSNN